MINKLDYYLQNKPSIDRLINELPSNADKAALQAKHANVLNALKASVDNPSAYETAEKQYKDLSAEVRYAKPRFIPQQAAKPVAPAAPVARSKPPVRVAKSSAEKDKAFINQRISGLEKQLEPLADTPDVLTAKSKLNSLKQTYAATNENDLLKFIQTEFGPVSNEINKVVIANKGNVKMTQTHQKSQPSISNFAAPVAPKKKEMSPEEFLAAHPELADDPSMMESILKEGASRTLMKTIAGKTGLPTAQLEQFWELAVQKNSKNSEIKDTAFWAGVMKEFQTLIDKTDIEESKNIMETREKYKEAAGAFLNSIAEDNYSAAQDAFKTMVDTRLNDNIAKRAEAYCQNVLSQEAKKLAKDS